MNAFGLLNRFFAYMKGRKKRNAQKIEICFKPGLSHRASYNYSRAMNGRKRCKR